MAEDKLAKGIVIDESTQLELKRIVDRMQQNIIRIQEELSDVKMEFDTAVDIQAYLSVIHNDTVDVVQLFYEVDDDE